MSAGAITGIVIVVIVVLAIAALASMQLRRAGCDASSGLSTTGWPGT